METYKDQNLYYELTDIQKNIWDMLRAYPGTPIANTGGIMKLPSGMTCTQAQEIANCYERLHPAMRLQMDKSGRMYVRNYEEFQMKYRDFTGEGKSAFEKALDVWFCEPFGEQDAPLYETRLMRYRDELYICGKYCHLIMDSAAIRSHIAAYYLEKPCGEEEDLRFLKLMEAGNPEPGKYARKLVERWKGMDVCWKLRERDSDGRADVQVHRIPETLAFRMKKISGEQRISPESLVSGAVYTYIAGVKHVKQAAVGRVFINRRKEQLDMPGMMANTLPVLISIDASEDFFTLCRRIQSECFGLMRCQGFSYRNLRSMAGLEEPLYDISISGRSEKYLPLGLALAGKECFAGYSEIPLRLLLDMTEEGISLSFLYQKDNYMPEEIQEMFCNLVYILEQGCENRALQMIEVVNPEYLRQVQEWNDTKKWTFRKSLWEYLQEQVRERPEEVLWEEESGERMTVRETEEAVRKVSRYLKEHGVKKGDAVGLVLERNVLLPVAMMAVMQAGAAFLPIGIHEKEETIADFAEHCQKIISSRELSLSHIRLNREILGGLEAGDEIWEHEPQAAAYAIFTSGSTGNPKIALICEEALMCRLEWMREQFGMEGSILQKTVNTFDVSVWELLMPFLSGSRGCLLRDGDERFPDATADAVIRRKVNILHFVPSMLASMLAYLNTEKGRQAAEKMRGTLTHIFSSGEELSPALADRVYRQFPGIRLVNLYGPAECTIDVSWHTCRPGEGTAPIGKPVYNTRLYVWGTDEREVPLGEEGELIVSGTLVGAGYLENEKEQAKRFFTRKGERLYRTGDRVRRLPNGEICYLGRENQETKVRGVRVDLGEIERMMMEYPDVSNACVMVHGNGLYGFYESREEIYDWKERLEKRLPRRTMPNRMVHVRSFPLQGNGKVNRKALAELPSQSAGAFYGEDQVRGVIEKYLQEFSDEENLLEAGLDSLTAVCIVSDLLDLGYDISYQDFYRNPSVRELKQLIARKKGASGEKDGEEPLFWFSKDGTLTKERISDRVLFCAPYAGGEFTLFSELAKKLWDGGIQMCLANSRFFAGDSPEEAAENLLDLLLEIPALSVMGCCVGAADAIALAGKLERCGRKPHALYLCGALPYTCKKDGKVLWDRLNRKQTGSFLSLLRGERVKMTEKEKERLSEEARRSAWFFRQRNPISINTRVYLLYGGRDLLTLGFPLRKRKWKRWFAGEVRTVRIAGARHFFVKTHAGQVADFCKDLA